MEKKALKICSKTMKLNNGIDIPVFGYGSSQVRKLETMVSAIRSIWENGYRLIDTAAFYENEKLIGNAIKHLNIPRRELFITSKALWENQSYDQAWANFRQSLSDLQTDYLDLYLIHFPTNNKKGRESAYKALEEMYEKKLVRSIGVSNFYENILIDFLLQTKIVPAVNQIELHPFFFTKRIIELCQKKGIVIEAYSPLGRGKVEILEHPTLKKIALNHKKTVPQVIHKWLLSYNVIVLSKSATPSRIKENIEIDDFELDKDEIAEIEYLNKFEKVIDNLESFLGMPPFQSLDGKI